MSSSKDNNMQFGDEDEIVDMADIAEQNHLSIRKVESHEIGEEIYDQLLYDSLYAKESGT